MIYDSELVRGTLKTIVLQVISENGRMYGYELSKKVKELTEDKIVLTEGALYPILHKLEKDQLVVTEIESVGNRKRKYYKLTPNGKEKAVDKRNELIDFIKTLETLLNPKSPSYELVRV